MTHTDGLIHARRHCFALSKKLIPRCEAKGISEDAFWNAVKREFQVDSRSEIDELGWVILSARFAATARHQQLFDVLCGNIRKASWEGKVQ